MTIGNRTPAADPNRREFIKMSAAGIGVGALAPSLLWSDEPKKKLKLLILGGTGFLGPHTVRAATARGHTMTLFNRGKTRPELFPDLEKLKGDRDGDLEALKDREWDAVIDTSGYFPRIVNDSAKLLAEKVKHYVFISSISVYADYPTTDVNEDSPVGTIDDPTFEQITNTSYGPLKALCEQAAEKNYPGRCTNIRPGLIVGPGDYSDRFTYWPVRVSEGGEVLAPDNPKTEVQFVDVRDLAEFIIHSIEAQVFGVFNAAGGKERVPLGVLLEESKRVSESDAEFTWVPVDFLEEQKVRPWGDLPLWIPAPEGKERRGYTDNSRIVAAGMKTRSVADTVKATLDWHVERCAEFKEKRGTEYKIRSGWSREREKEVLAAWRTAQKTG